METKKMNKYFIIEQKINNEVIFSHTSQLTKKIFDQVYFLDKTSNTFILSYKNKIYTIQLINKNKDGSFLLSINNKILTIKAFDPRIGLLKKIGISLTEKKINDIKAPMPGIILSVNCSKEQQVETGDPLLILEAMKMENVIKSPCSGIISDVFVEKGEVIEKNHLLITFKH